MATSKAEPGVADPLLDEVFWRPRRCLADGLRRARLWLPTPLHGAFMSGQRRRGRRLLHRLAGWAPVTGLERTLAPQTPFVLAFGYDLGAGLCALLGGRPLETARSGRLCALFNHGISVFDTMCDGQSSRWPALLAWCDGTVLERLIADAEAVRAFAAAGAAAPADLQPVLRAIAGFFTGLHELRTATGPSETWTELAALLVEAYQVEAASLPGMRPPDVTAVARATSTLPFQIMHSLARLSATRSSAGTPPTSGLVDALGTVFWLVDDLVDLCSDYWLGQVNALLASPCLSLDQVLASGTIDRAAETVVGELQWIEGWFARLDQPGPSVARLRMLILASARNAVC